ncbi:pseudouridine synthase deg1 [Sporothrix curviconia]|uniref:Pseudouridine synthase deg1 n=1 Tax=Sporothrix curviconia TaxID=1260050 RepID=A0ABP0BVP1_9PEZI
MQLVCLAAVPLASLGVHRAPLPTQLTAVSATRAFSLSLGRSHRRRKKTAPAQLVVVQETATGEMPDYTRWTKEALMQRIQELEETLQSTARATTATTTTGAASAAAPAAAAPTPKKPNKGMDPSRYGTRFIALRIAYLGKRYGGFEYQPSGALPSVEEELWKALIKACLIFPAPGMAAHEVDFNHCEYSKCGRTDRGVSAFGQVVALRVRSNRKRKAVVVEADADAGAGKIEQDGADGAELEAEFGSLPSPEEEIQYGRVLNRLLPPDIRVLAWCPTPPPDFSARFSCRERRYRYFFTQPAYFGAPSPTETQKEARKDGGEGNKPANGWLDIDAMRTAAKHFVGLHDFRNFCKIDPNKQITNYDRRIFGADIVEVPGLHSSLDYFGADGTNRTGGPKVYSFNVRGSAFLWHQIRHMVAILFLVGQGRESPDIIPALLDANANPGRPAYAMAEEAPLVLWDCIFPPAAPADAPEAAVDHPDAGNWTDCLEWHTVAEEAPESRAFMDGLWRGWHSAKMDEILANRLLDQVLTSQSQALASRALASGTLARPLVPPTPPAKKSHIYEGGDGPRLGGVYIPLLKRSRLASPEEQNDKFARSKGFASSAAMRDVGNWRAAIRVQKNAGVGAGDVPVVDAP